MDGQAPPSYSGPTQYPTTPFGNVGDESFNRTTMPPPRGSSVAPFPTPQPVQYGSENFIPGPSSPSSSNFSEPSFTYSPSGSIMPLSVISRPPLSPSSSGFRSPPSPVVNKDMTTYPPIPYSYGVENNRSYPNPTEMPVGVRSQKEGVGEEYVNVGNKRRASNEIDPPSRKGRRGSLDSSINGNSSVNDDATPPPPPPPQGVSGDVGNDNAAYGRKFTPYQLNKIAADDKLKKMVDTDPRGLRRLLANRKSAARSKARKAWQMSQLEIKVQTLETQIYKLTAALKLVNSQRMARDDECVQLRIRLQGWEEEASLRDALNKQLTGEVHRLTEEASGHRKEMSRQREEASQQREEISRLREEVSEYRRRETVRMEANMLEQLNINPQFRENPQTNYNFE